MNTTEILKAHAPEFVALDEAERKATPGPWRLIESGWEYAGKPAHYLSTQVGRDGVFRQNDTTFVYEARWSARALLDFCAQLLVEREWRPIETAPKNGTRVLLAFPHVHRPIEAWFDPCTERWYGIGVELSEKGSFPGIGSFPTHWMPLPQVPGAKP